MSFTFVDLFAGIGGFHSALESLGGECVLASDIDEAARKIYEINWRNKNSNFDLVGDIRPLTEGPKVLIPNHDVLSAGFPCQPFSKSGNQRGVNEARGTLFFNILKIVEARKPQIVILENVRNLVGPKHIQDFHKMIRLLRELGYAVSETPTIMSPHLLPKRNGGTPQHRERIFIGAFYVGSKRAMGLSEIRPILERNPFALDPHNEWKIKDYLKEESSFSKSELAELKISRAQKNALDVWSKFVRTHRSHSDVTLPGLPLWTEYWIKPTNLRIPIGTPIWKETLILRNSEFYNKNRNWINPWLAEAKLEELIPSYRKFEWQAGDLKNLKDCLIQFRPSGIRVKHPSYVPAFVAISQTPVIGWLNRELSVDEAKKIQGFPTKFKFNSQVDSLSFKQIGNAVHPGVCKFVMKELLQQAASYDHKWSQSILEKLERRPKF